MASGYAAARGSASAKKDEITQTPLHPPRGSPAQPRPPRQPGPQGASGSANGTSLVARSGSRGHAAAPAPHEYGTRRGPTWPLRQAADARTLIANDLLEAAGDRPGSRKGPRQRPVRPPGAAPSHERCRRGTELSTIGLPLRWARNFYEVPWASPRSAGSVKTRKSRRRADGRRAPGADPQQHGPRLPTDRGLPAAGRLAVATTAARTGSLLLGPRPGRVIEWRRCVCAGWRPAVGWLLLSPGGRAGRFSARLASITPRSCMAPSCSSGGPRSRRARTCRSGGGPGASGSRSPVTEADAARNWRACRLQSLRARRLQRRPCPRSTWPAPAAA